MRHLAEQDRLRLLAEELSRESDPSKCSAIRRRIAFAEATIRVLQAIPTHADQEASD